MLKRLATFLKRKLAPRSAPIAGEDSGDDTAPIFEGLAMTEELRDALFPKTPQMISAIFDRPAPLDRPLLAEASSPSSGSGDFPILL